MALPQAAHRQEHEEEIGIDDGRVDYSDYDERNELARRRAQNYDLSEFDDSSN